MYVSGGVRMKQWSACLFKHSRLVYYEKRDNTELTKTEILQKLTGLIPHKAASIVGVYEMVITFNSRQ